MIVFVYPANEPASCSSWVGDVVKEAGLGVSVESGHNNVDEVMRACGSSDSHCIFYGGTTQLSWLFDTDSKRSAFRAMRGKRIMLANEFVFTGKTRPEYRPRFMESVRCATHLVGFDRGGNTEEFEWLKQTGLPAIQIGSLPFAFGKCRNVKRFSDRRRSFLFVGTNYGRQRSAILKALGESGLVDVVQCPKSQPHLLVSLYNSYCGVVNPRSGHDEIDGAMIRPKEASACGCYVLDLQKFEACEAEDAVNLVRSVVWEEAETEATKQREESKRFDCLRMLPKLCEWAI